MRPDALEHWERLLRTRWKTGAAVFLPIFGLAAFLMFTARPVYRVEALLRLGEAPPMSGVSPTGGLATLFRMGGDPFANDLELLASRTLAERVVAGASLNATVAAPKGWHRDSLFQRLTADPTTRKAVYQASWQDDGTIAVTMSAPDDSAVTTVRPGQPATFGGVTVAFQPHRDGMPREVRIATRPFDQAVRLSRSKVKTERTRQNANVVELRVDHTDPGIAQAAAASAVSGFIALRTTLQRRESGTTVDSLRAVSGRTRDELVRAEAALSGFQRASGLVAPTEQAEAMVRQYAEAAAELETARAELALVDSVLARVDTWTDLVAHPRFLQNQTIGDLLTQLLELEVTRTELASRRTMENRELRVLDEQIGSIDRSLRRLVRGYREGLARQVVSLEDLVRRMDSTLVAVPGKAIELGRRQRDVRVLSEILVLTEGRLRQEELREALTFANVQVIDPPALLDKPVAPRKRLGLAIGFMLASVFATLGMVVRERADRSVRRALEVRTAIGAPVLGVLLRAGPGELRPASDEVRTAMRGAVRHLGAAAGLTVAAVEARAPVQRVAAALNGLQPPTPDPQHPTPSILVGPLLNTFQAAATAVESQAPIALVLEYGRTTYQEARRAAELVTQAGGTVAGAVVVVDTDAQATALWE